MKLMKSGLLLGLLMSICGLNAQKRLVTAQITEGIYSIYNEEVKQYLCLEGRWDETPAYNKALSFSNTRNNPNSYFYIKKEGDHYLMHPMNCDHKIGPMCDAVQLWQVVGTHLKEHMEYCDLLINPVSNKKGVYRIGLKIDSKYWSGNPKKTIVTIEGRPGQVFEASVTHGKLNKTSLRQQWKIEKMSNSYAYVDSNQKFMIKSATSPYYWDLKGDSDNSTNRNGTILWMSKKMLHTNDKRYKLKRDNGEWVYIQVQNGGRNINVDKSNLKTTGQQLELWDRKSDLKGQRYAIIPTSPTTCVFKTYAGLALENIGQKVKQNTLSFAPAQHWQLIYADGPKKGQPYYFKK